MSGLGGSGKWLIESRTRSAGISGGVTNILTISGA